MTKGYQQVRSIFWKPILALVKKKPAPNLSHMVGQVENPPDWAFLLWLIAACENRITWFTTSSYTEQIETIPSCSGCDKNMRWLELKVVVLSSIVLCYFRAQYLPFYILPNHFRSERAYHFLRWSNFLYFRIILKIYTLMLKS